MSESRLKPAMAFIAVLIALGLIVAGMLAIRPYLKIGRHYPKLTYNYFDFEQRDGTWYTDWQREGQTYSMGMRYNPLEVEKVTVSGRLNETFRNQPLYITFDPEQNGQDYKYIALAIAEFGLPAVRAMGASIQASCTQNITEACADHPIVTCDDDDKSVMYIRMANETKALLDGNCLIVQGSGMELLKAVDRALYHFLKIMP
jgi:hypothetical protein